MSKKTLKVKKSKFLENFLLPLSKVCERGIITVEENKISSLVANTEGIIFHSEILIENSECYDISIADFKKFTHLINCINDEDISLEIHNNHFKYNSNTIRFKYHFLENGIISKPKLNVEKIKSFPTHSSFTLSREKIKEIMRVSSISADTKLKCYFQLTDEGVFVDLTDQTQDNSDSIGVLVIDTFEGDKTEYGIPMSYDVFQLLSSLKSDFEVKINIEKRQFFIYSLSSECDYILTVSGLIN